MSAQRIDFWETKSLADRSQAEWESLCDGCGKCCLHKLIDDDTEELHYTDVACQLLDVESAQCSDYPNRQKTVPACTQLTLDDVEDFDWLPVSCSYRLVAAGLPLPEWHPLITGDRMSTKDSGNSVAGRCISETKFEGELQDRVIRWVD